MSETLTPPDLPAFVESEQTRFRLPSRPDLIEPTAEYLRRKAVLCGACLETHGGKLMVALLEAISNSIVHGNLEIASELKERSDDAFAQALATRAADPVFACRTVEIQVEYDGESCRWAFTDHGKGFDFDGAIRKATNPDPEDPLASGRGLMMMFAFLDEVRYEDDGRRVILTLHRRHKGGEKRGRPRLPMTDPIRVAPVNPDGSVSWADAYDAVGHNVSQDGLALLQAQAASSGRLMIGIPSGGETLYVPAEVKHVRPLGDGEVELGCRFLRPPCAASESEPAADAASEHAVAELVERLTTRRTTADERRAHPRVHYTERVEVSGLADGSVVYGFARDLARGGIAFILTVQLATETVTLSLPQGSGRPPLRVRARVVRCNRVMDGFYDVGARFLG